MTVDQDTVALADPVANMCNLAIHGHPIGADQLFHIATRTDTGARENFL
jgi:hypothetical protein